MYCKSQPEQTKVFLNHQCPLFLNKKHDLLVNTGLDLLYIVKGTLKPSQLVQIDSKQCRFFTSIALCKKTIAKIT